LHADAELLTAPAMIDGELFPTVFFMAVIGLIVFVAVSQILLDKPE
jgi:hypothetical protein